MKNQSPELIIVSAIVTPIGTKTYEDLDFFKHLDFRCIVFYDGPEFEALQGKLELDHPVITLCRPSYRLPELPDDTELPGQAEVSNGAFQELINLHSKVAYMRAALDVQSFSSCKFLWMDIGIQSVLSDHIDDVSRILQEVSESHPLGSEEEARIVIPGYWKPLTGENLTSYNNGNMDWLLQEPHWRFIGSVFMGSRSAIVRFWELYEEYFVKFLENYQVLVWEVNFWAWLEAMVSDWKPLWYKATYDVSLMNFPAQLRSVSLKTQKSYVAESYQYPTIKDYHPTSASYLQLDGKHWLNTRFVNYWLKSNGEYWFPPLMQDVIKTKNILSQLDESLCPIDFIEMGDQVTLANNFGFSQGVEDVRLFEDAETLEVKFIGSNYNYSADGKIRMLTGIYDVESKVYEKARFINPPTYTDCEKNWIPIQRTSERTLSKPEQWYIYQWCPMQVGKIDVNATDDDKGSSSTHQTTQLKIGLSHDTNPLIFQGVRGSTCFIESEIEGAKCLLGVVHFSDDSMPRKYYHRLVVLSPVDFKPIKYSPSFYFENNSVEFCIGFTQWQDCYVFWISQMDRDPLKVTISCAGMSNWTSA